MVIPAMVIPAMVMPMTDTCDHTEGKEPHATNPAD